MISKDAITYYSATASERPDLPAVEGDVAADVCIVGAGITGCSAALELALRGYRVIVLEADRVGAGASGRNGGQVLTGYSCGQRRLEKEVGFETARRMWDLSVEAVTLLRQRVEQYGIDCDLRSGHLQAAVKRRHRSDLLALQEQLQLRYGYDQLQFIDGAEVRQQIATDRYVAALFDRHCAHLHPLKFTLGLARAAIEAGASIHEHSRAQAIDYSDPAIITTANGRVRARFVILCGNASLEELVPALRPRIMPIRSYIAVTRPLGERRATELIRGNYAVADTNFVVDFFRRTADHRLLFGGGVSYSGRDFFGTARLMRQRVLRVFGQLTDVAIEYAWGCNVDISFSRAPDFGRLLPNIYYLQGFSGHGLALSGMAGKLAAEAIAQQAERFDLFPKLQHRNFPGGRILRTPTLVLAMLWFRLRDLI